MRIGIKHIAILVVALMNLGFGSGNNDLEESEIKGKVKSITAYKESKVLFGDTSKSSRILKDVLLFNRFGNLSESYRYYTDGSIDSKTNYKHDNKGNKSEGSGFTGDGSLDFKTTFKYDKKGNKIEESRYNSDGSLSQKEIYKYDKDGNKIEWIWFIVDGNLKDPHYKTLYKYNEYGHLVKENIIAFSHKLVGMYPQDMNSYILYEYDRKGNKVEKNEHNYDGSLLMQLTYKYDKYGNMIEKDGVKNLDRSVGKFVYKHDKIGNVIKKISYTNGIPKSITEYEYEYYK